MTPPESSGAFLGEEYAYYGETIGTLQFVYFVGDCGRVWNLHKTSLLCVCCVFFMVFYGFFAEKYMCNEHIKIFRMASIPFSIKIPEYVYALEASSSHIALVYAKYWMRIGSFKSVFFFFPPMITEKIEAFNCRNK